MKPFYAVFLLAIAFVCVSKPLNNFDMVPYAVTTYAAKGQTFEQAHASAYDLVKRKVAIADYHKLTDVDSIYRSTLQRDPVAMGQQIPFYSVKAGYIALLRMFPDPVFGTRILAVSGYLIMGIMVWLLLAETLAGWKLLLSSALIMLTPAAVEPARMSTPDTLGCAFMLTALYAGCRNRWIIGMGAASVAIFFRPDAFIFAALLAGIAWWKNESRIAVGVMFSAIVGSYLVTTFGSYGWITLFQHSLVGRITHPTETVIGFHASTYLVWLGRGLLSLQISGLVAYLILLPWALKSKWLWALGLMVVYSALHYFYLPAADVRYFMAPCLLIAVAALSSRTEAVAA